MSNNGVEKNTIAVTLSTGVTLHVTPLSVFARQLIIEASERLYPLPDPKPFEIPVPDSRAGQVVPATQNPDYQELEKAIKNKRENYQRKAMLATCCDSPEQAALIERYAPRLARLDEFIDAPEDQWEAVLLLGVIQTDSDMALLVTAAMDRLQLTEAEIVDGMRTFRSPILLARSRRRGSDKESQGAANEQRVETQQSTG